MSLSRVSVGLFLPNLKSWFVNDKIILAKINSSKINKNITIAFCIVSLLARMGIKLVKIL